MSLFQIFLHNFDNTNLIGTAVMDQYKCIKVPPEYLLIVHFVTHFYTIGFRRGFIPILMLCSVQSKIVHNLIYGDSGFFLFMI